MRELVATLAGALIIASAASSAAHAEPRSFPPDVIGVLAGESKPAAELSFVGRSGQIYLPSSGSWERDQVGGIATDVIGAVRTPSGIYAIPDRAPMFRRESGVWQATPLANRGYSAFQPHGAMTMAALGRHVYRLDGGRWVRYATAARRVTAIFAAAKNRVYVATTRGRLRRTDGSRFAVIKNKLPTSDSIRTLLGKAGGELYGLSREGRILSVGASEATEVTIPRTLTGLELHTLGYGPGKAIFGAGVVRQSDGGAKAVLVELKQGEVREVSALSELARTDRFAAVHTAADGVLVVVTYGGQVGMRKADGSWETRQVSGRVPESKAASAPAGAAPARSR